MKEVFVDTGAWIAVVDENDRHHSSAVEYIKEILRKDISLISTNYILDETITWIKYRLGHSKAVKFKELRDKNIQSGRLSVCWIDREIHGEAWKIFKKYGDHSLSYTDCTSFAVCRRRGISQVFGFDEDFNILGFLLNPYQVREERTHYNVLTPN
ncbi:MAG: type II toxin-antitoxin system VapC family toxin [Halanaerobiales bacterium]